MCRYVRVLTFVFFVIGPITGVRSHEFKAGSLVIESPWTRATPVGAKIGGGYLTIKNIGSEPDRLIGGSLPIVGHVEVHEMRLEADVMRMRVLPNDLEIAPGSLLATLLTAPVQARDVKAGDLVIAQPWTRATPGGAKVAGGYLTIENKGSTPDRLVSGSTNVAKKIEIHEMAMNNGVMTMRPIDGGLVIEPGKAVKLAPGGYHLMFLELNSPFKQGDTIAVTLKFEKAGEVKVLFDVQGVGAQGPGASNGSGGAIPPGKMDMQGMPSASANASSAPIAVQPDESFFTHIHTEKAMANVTVSSGRAGPVIITIQLETTDELPLIAKAVSVTLTNLQAGVEARTSQAERGGDDQWRVKMSAPVPGRWMLGLGIVISDSDRVSMDAPILIK